MIEVFEKYQDNTTYFDNLLSFGICSSQYLKFILHFHFSTYMYVLNVNLNYDIKFMTLFI